MRLESAGHHVHDYQMVFRDTDDPSDGLSALDYRLICACGDEAPNIHEALRRIEKSRRAPDRGHRLRMVVSMAFVVLGFAFLSYAVLAR